MRKITIWIGTGLFFVVAALLIVGFWWWKSGQNENFAAYLPSETLAVIYAPDGMQTYLHFQNSNLKKVIECPEGKALSEAMAGLTGEGMSDEAQAKLQKGKKDFEELIQTFWPNLSGKSFLAVTKIDPGHPEQSSVIIGFEPHFGPATFDPFWVKFVADLKETGKDTVHFGTGEYEGVSFETLEGTGKLKSLKVCKAKVGLWVVLSNGEEALKDFVNRHQKLNPSESLAGQPEYQKLCKRLSNCDVMAYGNIAQGCKLAEQILSKNLPTNTAIANITKTYQPFPALGGKIAFDGALLKSQWVILSPKEQRPDLGIVYQPCEFRTLTYTSDDTVFYEASQLDLSKQWEYMLKTSADPKVNEGLKSFEKICEGAGLDLRKNVLEAIGPEFCLIVDWMESDPYPNLAIISEVAKPDDLQPAENALVKMAEGAMGGPSALKDSTAGPTTLKTISLPFGKLSPTFTSSGKVFAVFTSQESAQRILGKQPGDTIYDQEEFKALGSPVFNGSNVGAYINTPRIVDRCYGYVKPMAQLASHFLPGKLATAVSHASLPEKLSFSSDLGAWVMREHVDDEAFQVDTVTGAMNPFIPVGFIAGAAIGMAQNQMLPGHRQPVPPSPDVPPNAAGLPEAKESTDPAPTGAALAPSEPNGTQPAEADPKGGAAP